MRGQLGPAVALEPRDEGLEIGGAALVRDERRIRHRHHDQILDPERGEEARFRAQIGIARGLGDDVAREHVAGVVLRADLPQRVPRADIAPAHLDRHDRGMARVLHHRVVERDVLARG